MALEHVNYRTYLQQFFKDQIVLSSDSAGDQLNLVFTKKYSRVSFLMPATLNEPELQKIAKIIDASIVGYVVAKINCRFECSYKN